MSQTGVQLIEFELKLNFWQNVKKIYVFTSTSPHFIFPFHFGNTARFVSLTNHKTTLDRRRLAKCL